ncbi:hypothetical protein Rhopal_005311-T1 [Rhodotorula paludigena]|uniref:Uncharacterized protein n=1 Tax=Rhodotorula paludigena TaxID=86838 RepID=A0AAV5GHZ4_9BASI|nr:hypothetical protein Rhopal_005311-T1 [Rhodotorula paludigena]
MAPQTGPRKTVYRPVLDNPLTVQWSAILDELLALLSAATTSTGKGIADWRLDEHARRRGNQRGAGKGKGKGKTRDHAGAAGPASDAEGTRDGKGLEEADMAATVTDGETLASSNSRPSTSKSASHAPAEPAPALLSHLVVGINEVTRALESRIRWGRWELGDARAAPSSSASTTPAPVADARKGRHRRRKSSSDHPAYAFTRERAPAPRSDALPPYVVPGEEDAPVRLLVNSDARRIKRGSASSSSSSAGPAPPTALLAAQPASHPFNISVAASTVSPTAPPPTVPLVDLILVCKPDINPPSLVAHLPTMVAAANGVQTALDSVLRSAEAQQRGEEEMQVEERASGTKRPEMRPVRLVPLDVGAERRLADALGLRRVAAVGLSSLHPAVAPLLQLLQTSLPDPLSAPWLVPHVLHPPSSTAPAAASRFAPTAIKHLKTSAPLNPRAAVVAKKEERKRKKEEQREKRKRRKVERDGEDGAEDGVYVAED